MKAVRISDQYYDWSDSRYRKRFARRLAAAKEATGRAAAAPGVGVARLADRTLQAMWKTWMQVRTGAGPRPEVLPFGQPIGIDPANGLRSLRVSTAGSGVRGELSPGARHSQTDLRHQPRTVAPTAATVDPLGECDSHNGSGRLCSRADGGRAGRQHAPRLLCAATTSQGAKR
jgi:hypothetical protein